MYKRLTDLMKTKQEAKKYCHGVIDDISDNEEEDIDTQNTTRTNFYKYLSIENQRTKTKQNIGTLSLKFEILEKAHERKKSFN